MTHKIVDVIGSARIVGGETGRLDKGVIWVFGRPEERQMRRRRPGVTAAATTAHSKEHRPTIGPSSA
jgi:hypothetical protein